MSKEKALDKVRKLLEKTVANGATDAEANSALLMAQKILAKHNLEMSEVEMKTKNEGEVVETKSSEVITAPWKIKLANIVAKNFRCMFLLQGYSNSNTKTPLFVGLKEDAEICKEVFETILDWLYNARNRVYREYRKAGKATKGLKADYTLGFLKGLNENFTAQRTAMETENAEYAMVMVTPKAVVEKVESMKTGQYSHKGFNNYGGNTEAIEKGYGHGKSYGVGLNE